MDSVTRVREAPALLRIETAPGTYVLVLLTKSTNGHPLASVPESRVTVADPSTVLMARRKFPGSAASPTSVGARGWRWVLEQT